MPDVEVRGSSIEGLGIFALRPFPSGELIRRMNLVREVTPEAPLRPELGEHFKHCAYPDGKVFLVGLPDRHFNHSCDPNAYERFEGSDIEIVARRDIEAGEEITVDYLMNNSGGDSWPCNCGAARCRGQTARSFFHLPAPIQHEYLPLLAPWFVRRHGREIETLKAKLGDTTGTRS